MKNIIITLVFFSPLSMLAQGIIGTWNTVDDNTGEVRSTVEIYLKESKAFGKVVAIKDPQQQDAVCEKCGDSDPRKNQRILGMEIIKGLKKNGKEWINGEILDPENGKVYKCKIWLENGSLVVRGYLGFTWLGRSQTWIRSPK
jgi:uncharacterized protein (DUF2147 family)